MPITNKPVLPGTMQTSQLATGTEPSSSAELSAKGLDSDVEQVLLTAKPILNGRQDEHITEAIDQAFRERFGAEIVKTGNAILAAHIVEHEGISSAPPDLNALLQTLPDAGSGKALEQLADLAEFLHAQARVTKVLHNLQKQEHQIGMRPIAVDLPGEPEASSSPAYPPRPTEPALALVITAHPTRTSHYAGAQVESEILELASRLHKERTVEESGQLRESLAHQFGQLIALPSLRPQKPTVDEEHQELVVDTLAQTVNAAKNAGKDGTRIAFRTWCAGDHDGHDKVFAHNLTNGAVERSSNMLKLYERKIDSIIERQNASGEPEVLKDRLHGVKGRIGATHDAIRQGEKTPDGAGRYFTSAELRSDINQLAAVLPDQQSMQNLKIRSEDFGLHYAAVDLRQNASVFTEMASEFYVKSLRGAGTEEATDSLPKAYKELPREEKTEALRRMITDPDFPYGEIDSPAGKKEMELIKAGLDLRHRISPEALGYQIIANTSNEFNLLEAILAIRAAGGFGHDSLKLPVPVVPLFETVEDLRNAPEVMDSYNHALQKIGLTLADGPQPIMVGYSDSNKDGGFLSSRWGVFKATNGLALAHQTAANAGVPQRDLTIFHGNGGSEARGGGDLALTIKARPPVGHTSEWTVQGEALNTLIPSGKLGAGALSQLAAANTLRIQNPHNMDDDHRVLLDQLSDQADRAYRDFHYSNAFTEIFFALPQIFPSGLLNAGSRPAARTTADELKVLSPEERLKPVRAISHNIPTSALRSMFQTVYGFGTAVERLQTTDPQVVSKLKAAYEKSPVLKSLLADLETGMAKASPAIVGLLLDRLAQEDPSLAEPAREFHEAWVTDYFKGKEHLLAITGQRYLLENRPELKMELDARLPIANACGRLTDHVAQHRSAMPTDQDLRQRVLAASLSASLAALQNAA